MKLERDEALCAAGEIAEMLGVTRQRVAQIAAEQDDFPEPIAVLSTGRIWRRADVETWARKAGRLA